MPRVGRADLNQLLDRRESHLGSLVSGRDLPEELVDVVRSAQGMTAQVLVEVERRIDLAVRQRHVERGLDDSVA